MLYEYAVEPTLLNNWEAFRYFIENFGVPQGRLISHYPKRWKKMVYESLVNCGEIERKRIEDRLQALGDRILLKRQHKWDPQQDWLINAEAEHSCRPFHAILANANPHQREYILEGKSVSEKHPLWAAPKSLPVLRVAQEMATRVAPLLRASKEILFIDPHFRPKHARYQRPLGAFLAAALEQRYGEPPTRIEIHTNNDELGADFFRRECLHYLPGIIPKGVCVHLIRWRQREGGEKLHNRFILTDMGGVMFGVGLDDGDGAEGETDDIELLSDEKYRSRWAQYQYRGLDSAFELVDKLAISGEAASPDGRAL